MASGCGDDRNRDHHQDEPGFPMRWCIITGEYPPAMGGVAAYTRQLAWRLAARGEQVMVATVHSAHAPHKTTGPTGKGEVAHGVAVCRLPGGFSPRGLIVLERLVRDWQPQRLLLQYTPHAFGYKSMNLPLVEWLRYRGRRPPLWVMFHEVAFPWTVRPLRHAVLAMVHRWMARELVAAAARLFVATPAWEAILRACSPRPCRIDWLPVPSPVEPQDDAACAIAQQPPYAVGHFGTYSPSIVRLLETTLEQILHRRSDATLALIGRGSDSYREAFLARRPQWRERVVASGCLPDEGLADWLRACHVMVQPYPDGVTARRTTAMAVLATSRPLVTNAGPLSEPLWQQHLPIAATPEPAALAALTVRLLEDASLRRTVAQQGSALYRQYFCWERAIQQLLSE